MAANHDETTSPEEPVAATPTAPSPAGRGPGLGDVIVYLANVRVIWSFLNGDVSLSVLDWEDVVYASAQSIRSEVQNV